MCASPLSIWWMWIQEVVVAEMFYRFFPSVGTDILFWFKVSLVVFSATHKSSAAGEASCPVTAPRSSFFFSCSLFPMLLRCEQILFHLFGGGQHFWLWGGERQHTQCSPRVTKDPARHWDEHIRSSKVQTSKEELPSRHIGHVLRFPLQ